MTSVKKPPPNRTVAVLTPLVFAPLAGAISVAAAEFAPGMDIDQNSLTAIFIAGATIAFGKAAQWTKGWQAQEQRTAAAPHDAPADLDGDVDELIGDLPETTGEADLAGGDEFAEEIGFEDELEFDEDPELAFEMDEDIDDEFMALTAGHEE